jgi:hypothetical protein
MDCERCARMRELLEKAPRGTDDWKENYNDIYLLFFTDDAMRDSTDTTYDPRYDSAEEETKDLTETLKWGERNATR